MFQKMLKLLFFFIVLVSCITTTVDSIPLRKKVFIKNTNRPIKMKIKSKELSPGVAEIDEYGLPWQAGGIWVGLDKKRNNSKDQLKEEKDFKYLVKRFLDNRSSV